MQQGIMTDKVGQLRDSTDALRDQSELQRRLNDESYLFFRKLQDPHAIMSLRKQMLETIHTGGWLEPGSDPMAGIARVEAQCTEGDRAYTDVYHKVYKLEAFHRIAHEPELVATVERIAGRPVMPSPMKIARTWFPHYTEHTTPVHQDFVHFQGSFGVLTCWAPVGECPVELGGLAVLRGSHKVGKVVQHHFALGAGGLGVDLETAASEHPELDSGEWLTADYEPGDTLIFPALTVHKALPNVTNNRLRVSLDNRYHPVGDRIAAHMLRPHLSQLHALEWEEVYDDWPTDDMKYYWEQYDNPIVPMYTGYHERGFHEAVELARTGDSRALLHLKRVAQNNPESEGAAIARIVLEGFGV